MIGRVLQQRLYDQIRHFIPAALATFLFQIVAIQIYHHNPIKNSYINFFIWALCQLIGGYLWGLLSDNFCRKKILILTQLLGCIFLAFLLYTGYKNPFAIGATGLLFAPQPVAKAALIDNFPKLSKVRVIGVTFIALLLPWTFFQWLVSQDIYLITLSALTLLLLNSLFSIFFFEDKRDLNLNHKKAKSGIFNKNSGKKAIFVGLALIPAQMVFFLADSFFEEAPNSAPYFTMLGWGALIGAVASIFYTKIPHISVIAVCYVLGLIFCLEGLIGSIILNLSAEFRSILILLSSTLGGFYLPFVYDAILSSVHSEHRGATCGVIEGIISISGFLALIIILNITGDNFSVLILMTFLFLIATILQRKSEKAK